MPSAPAQRVCGADDELANAATEHAEIEGPAPPPARLPRSTARSLAGRSRLSRARPLQREFLHAASGGRFADVEVALVVDAHPVRPQKLSDLPTAASELADDLEIRSPQHPDLVVGAVRHVKPLLRRVGRVRALCRPQVEP